MVSIVVHHTILRHRDREDSHEKHHRYLDNRVGEECSVSEAADITHTNNVSSQTSQRFILNPISSLLCSDDVRRMGNTRGGKPMLSDIFDLLNEKENEINLSQPSRYTSSSAPLKRASTMPPMYDWCYQRRLCHEDSLAPMFLGWEDSGLSAQRKDHHSPPGEPTVLAEREYLLEIVVYYSHQDE